MRFLLVFTLFTSFAAAQVSSPPENLSDVREDVRLLSQNVGSLTLRVEQLERENTSLRQKADLSTQAYVTVDQLNQAVAELNRTIKASGEANRSDILQRVSIQMEKLANQTNAALESLSRGSHSTRVAAAPTPANATVGSAPVAAAPSASGFSDNYPKEGISYTVLRGDTLSKIAAKTGGKPVDIINANKLTDPSRIRVGQVLFVPVAK